MPTHPETYSKTKRSTALIAAISSLTFASNQKIDNTLVMGVGARVEYTSRAVDRRLLDVARRIFSIVHDIDEKPLPAKPKVVAYPVEPRIALLTPPITLPKTKSNPVHVVQPKPKSYTVEAGDSLWAIAQHYNTSMYALADDNHLNLEAILPVGKVLTLPTGAKATETTTLITTPNQQTTLPNDVPRSTQAASFTPNSSLAEWLLRLRDCESGGNYSEDTGNGFYGAYQFTIETWDHWNTGYATANLAPPSVQDAVIVENTLSTAGLSTQNPGCYASTGLSNYPP